jgi:hypothetical protein
LERNPPRSAQSSGRRRYLANAAAASVTGHPYRFRCPCARSSASRHCARTREVPSAIVRLVRQRCLLRFLLTICGALARSLHHLSHEEARVQVQSTFSVKPNPATSIQKMTSRIGGRALCNHQCRIEAVTKKCQVLGAKLAGIRLWVHLNAVGGGRQPSQALFEAAAQFALCCHEPNIRAERQWDRRAVHGARGSS